LNTVIALRRLGINVGWMAKLGNDFFSDFIDHVVDSEGLDKSLLSRAPVPQRRVTVALSYHEERAFVTYIDPVYKASADLAVEALEHATFSHLHFTGLTLDERLPDFFDRCHERGICVSMDCQYREQTLDMLLVRETVRRLDIFMPNASEAQRLTRTERLAEALDKLDNFVPYIVIKCGAEGALARRDGIDYHSPAVPANVIDTTGAGDVFNAGFLAAHLAGKATLECLRWGNYCASMSVQGVGGISTAPTLSQLQAWLAAPPQA